MASEERPATRAELLEEYKFLIQTYIVSPILSAKERELANVAALASMGSRGTKQLAPHIDNALSAGATRQEVSDCLATISQAIGTSISVNSLTTAFNVFEARDNNGKASDAEKVWLKDNDVHLHPEAAIKHRELFLVSTYIAMNATPLQIIRHMHAALANGWTRQELGEVITVLAPHVGILNAMSALGCAKYVFDDRDARGVTAAHENDVKRDGRNVAAAHLERAAAELADLNSEGLTLGEGWDLAKTYAPGLYGYALVYLYGDRYQRVGLDRKTKLLAVAVAAAAHGGASEQLRFFVESALNGGVTRNEIIETIHLMSAVGSVGKTLNALSVAEEVFTRRDLLKIDA